jgi:hypothetical protein
MRVNAASTRHAVEVPAQFVQEARECRSVKPSSDIQLGAADHQRHLRVAGGRRSGAHEEASATPSASTRRARPKFERTPASPGPEAIRLCEVAPLARRRLLVLWGAKTPFTLLDQAGLQAEPRFLHPARTVTPRASPVAASSCSVHQ